MKGSGEASWGGDTFFSHGSTHSKGVYILVNLSLSSSASIENSSKDRDVGSFLLT